MVQIEILKKIGSAFLFCLVFWAAQAFGGTFRFEATVDQNEISVDDNVTLTLTVSSDSGKVNQEEPRLPDLAGFELLNKWTQSESNSVYQNGKFLFLTKQIYKYTLAPQKSGTLTIGAAEVNVEGQTLTTRPITIKVLAAGSGAPRSNVARGKQGRDEDEQAPGGPFDDDEANDLFTQLLKRRGLLLDRRGGIRTAPQQPDRNAFFITVEANKRKVYVGEQVIASWYLYTRGAIQAFDALKYPELKGFWKEDLEMATRLNFQSEVVNGVPYQKALLVSYALFPIAAGKKNLDTMKAKATVIDMDSSMSMFGLGHPYSYVKSSQELPIEVIPLPTQGRPSSFSGAVGKFTITGSLSSTQVKVNQPVSLKIRFQGQGNVKAIELPDMNLPKNLEVYDTKKDSQYYKTGEGYKEFEVLLIPRSVGDVEIPPVSVSYFDPKAAKYISQSTPAFKLKVLPGDGNAPNGVNVPMAQLEQSNQPVMAKDIRYLKTSASLSLPPKFEKIGWPTAFLLVWGVFGAQLMRLYRGGTEDHSSRVKKRIRGKMKQAMQKLKKGDWRGVGVETSNAVLSTLAEVVGSGGVSLTAVQMVDMMNEAPQKLKDETLQLLNRCEVLSFAPEALNKSQQQPAELKKIIHDAEGVIARLFEWGKREGSLKRPASPEADLETS